LNSSFLRSLEACADSLFFSFLSFLAILDLAIAPLFIHHVCYVLAFDWPIGLYKVPTCHLNYVAICHREHWYCREHW
jgi:hypothetical protein